jgi:hypothetical protein
MKKSLLSLVALLLIGFTAQAQNAEEIIAKHLKATGGDKWASVNSIRMEAKISSPAAAGMSIGWNLTAVRDKSARMDVSVMGMTQTTVVSGDKGWGTNPFAGQMDPEPLTSDVVESLKEVTDIDGTFVGYKEKGYTVEYVGTEEVEGTEALKVKIVKGKKVEYSYFDPSTYYEIKQVEVEEVDGKTSESATLFSNFKTQDGIVIPFTMQQEGGPMGAATITMSTVTFNPTIDAALFDMPKK